MTLIAVGCQVEGRPDDEDDRSSPCEGRCDASEAGLAAVPVAVQSISWDGQIVIGSAAEDGACRVMAVRPEFIEASNGSVSVPPTAFSPGVACPSALPAHALVAEPGSSSNPSIEDGAASYRVLVYASTDDDALPALTVRAAEVVVADPGTDAAEVLAMTWSGEAQPLLDGSGQPLHGIAPTVTADGRVLIFQGRPGDATDGEGRLMTDSLVYTRLEDAEAGLGRGWTSTRSLTQLVTEANVLVDGVALAQRMPLAAGLLRVPDGRNYPSGLLMFGEHPWVSRDGTELFFTATAASEPDADGRTRRVGGLSVVGVDTGHTVRLIDGPANPSRETVDGPATRRGLALSPGRAPGFWTPYVGRGSGIPMSDGPSYPLLGTVGTEDAPMGAYNEVDFEAFTDRDYLLVLPMNESLVPSASASLDHDPTQTPDLSGGFHSGYLENGARFAVEQFGLDPQGRPVLDRNTGAHGRAIYFSERGRVRVPLDWELRDGGPSFTVQLFVQRLEDATEARAIFTWPGVAEIWLHPSGRVETGVIVEGELRSAGPVEGPTVDAWTHVAMTYDAATGTVRTFIDGQVLAEASFSPALTDGATGDLTIGPDGRGEGIGELEDVAMVALDEVSISRVLRSDEEIARAAGTFVAPTPRLDNDSLLELVELPLGLSADALLVPEDNPVEADAVELGRMLFFDPRLSANGEVSCATCHDPEFGWSDGLPTGFGIEEQALTRNSPTILNIAFSREQFWDGRSATAEEQALLPIVSPVEMGSTPEQVLSFLASEPGYASRFESVYGEGPTQDNLAQAIASFERTVLSGNSPVDQFEAGQLDALGEAALRGRELFHGRARCVSCHSGSNYTDEGYHFTGLLPLTEDLGRFGATGRTKELFAFKTPTLRNIADTGPYFHDGSVATLADVVELYSQGASLLGHDREIRPLDLSAEEQADLVAFLEALSDPAALAMEPPVLPGLE